MTATAIKEKPILFSGEMVRAILAGRKTMTRRVIKQPKRRDGCEMVPELLRQIGVGGACPYGAVGDRLWVRETFRIETNRDVTDVADSPWKPLGPVIWEEDEDDRWYECARYRASEPDAETVDDEGNILPWRPSIFMPRWAARITLEVTGVRVERLQEITEEDAQREGVEREFEIDAASFIHGKRMDFDRISTYRLGFKHLWDAINGERGGGVYAWDKSPWVWVVSFKRLEQLR